MFTQMLRMELRKNGIMSSFNDQRRAFDLRKFFFANVTYRQNMYVSAIYYWSAGAEAWMSCFHKGWWFI